MTRWSKPRRPEASLADLLMARDRDAMTGFFDARAGYVRAYCAGILPAPAVEDATFAAFVEFLARVKGAGTDDNLDLLLVKATRSAAAGRMAIDSSEPACRAMPEVLASRANGEHRRNERAFEAHLEACALCRETGRRLLGAEQELKGEPSAEPNPEVRDRWLALTAAP
jgi:hypothetical protein